jgi:hypothetical protein
MNIQHISAKHQLKVQYSFTKILQIVGELGKLYVAENIGRSFLVLSHAVMEA